MAFLRKLGGVEPMLAVNLGTRGIAEAVQLLDYANHPGGAARSDLRLRHGDTDPYDIRLWCLGNEMDGPWQIGHKSADDYGRLAMTHAEEMLRTYPAGLVDAAAQFLASEKYGRPRSLRRVLRRAGSAGVLGAEPRRAGKRHRGCLRFAPVALSRSS